MNQDQEQIVLLAEILLFICVITSRKNFYIDRIRDLENAKFVNIFFSRIEKYILLESKDDEYNKSFSELSKSYIGYFSNYNTNHYNNLKSQASSSEFDSYKALKQLLDQEREIHRKTLREHENEIFRLNIKVESYDKTITDLEAKLRDRESELAYFKSNNQLTLKVQEESYNNSAFNQELKNRLKSKESEIDDLKRKNELSIKRLNEELFRAKEKNDNLEDKLIELNNLREQNEKLFTKIKEMNIYKDKKIEFENLISTNETRNKQIELLVKEKQSLLGQIDNLCDELQKVKEKLSICEYEKKNLEYEIFDLKKDYSRLENKQYQNIMNISDKKSTINFNSNNVNFLNNFNSTHNFNTNNNKQDIISNIQGNNNNNFYLNNSVFKEFNKENNEGWVKLNEIGMESVIDDIGMENKNIKNYEKEYQELITEKNEILKSLKEQIDQNQSLILDRDKLSAELTNLKNTIEKLNSEKDKILIEKGKLEIFIQKQELELQKSKISYEYESKKHEENIKGIANKNEILKSENLQYIQEIENLKLKISTILSNNNTHNNIINNTTTANNTLNNTKKPNTSNEEIFAYNNKKNASNIQSNNSDSYTTNSNNNSNKKIAFVYKEESTSDNKNRINKVLAIIEFFNFLFNGNFIYL